MFYNIFILFFTLTSSLLNRLSFVPWPSFYDYYLGIILGIFKKF